MFNSVTKMNATEENIKDRFVPLGICIGKVPKEQVMTKNQLQKIISKDVVRETPQRKLSKRASDQMEEQSEMQESWEKVKGCKIPKARCNSREEVSEATYYGLAEVNMSILNKNIVRKNANYLHYLSKPCRFVWNKLKHNFPKKKAMVLRFC